MSGVQEWIGVICISAIACTMLEFMAPNGKMEKIVRIVFGAFMIIAIISPLVDTAINVNFKLDNKDLNKASSNFNQKICDQSIELASNNIKKIVEDELNRMNLKSKKIDVIMDKEDKDCISISKVKIYIDNSMLKNKEEVRNKLKEKLNLNIEVL